MTLALVAIAEVALAGTALGVTPENDGSTRAASSPTGENATGPAGAQHDARPAPRPTRGFDISYPQCGGAYPSNPAFGIVGVNGGKVFSVNPCLASQITWGGGAAAELYANTGNPGPALSSFWPTGQATPRFCDPNNRDTVDCAFDYGFNAAKHSYETAAAAYKALGLTTSPSGTRWWLDVETSNSWRSSTALNLAALQGELAYLRDVAGVTRIGFYSTQLQWNEITGGTKTFSAYPSWVAGGVTLKGAQDRCKRPAFTGGAVVLAQYFFSGYDANVRC